MRVLLIGSGGREHALAWALSASPLLTELFAAPGNAGICEIARCVALDVADHAAIVRFCREQAIGLVVVGPEVPLVAGIVDDLAAAGIRAFGPTRAAAALEGSKAFTKELCREAGIPTAGYAAFADRDAAMAHVAAAPLPIVVKADGLAAGKGVTVALRRDEAEAAVDAVFAGGPAMVVIEEFLEGEEASFFALSDGRTVLPFATAQDHKRAFDGDAGPNTGGMGAYSPAPVMTEALVEATMERIVRPTVAALAARGIPYRGVLYAGLMICADGPKLIEYNVRFGDPECQVLMMRLKDDLLTLMAATVDGVLDRTSIRWHEDAALTVVMASRGYPGAYATGSEILGLDRAGAAEGVEIFHAGTRREDGRVLAAGGRVLDVTARGASVAEARERAYRAVDLIDWPEGFCRRDIGWRAVARERQGRA
ncbi:phosphoribosylamine--glycine ligase [Propylenella binzhouense]|uniref:Phosphoribosylamine--glycine ligase n=1 Tax=Propylenella binzhouense TaxID=2555902 RepID=A0A964WVC2_9HYPH|nr:phosphoribosylamine--glycine ligase [Propylenella binzhouense]MYZ49909.1 phosphoribosylamine--glycine ligase [Propylenella binzhouense]